MQIGKFSRTSTGAGPDRARRAWREAQLPLVACVWMLAACASPERQPVRHANSVPPPPTQPAEAPAADAADEPPNPPPIEPELERLVRSVRALEDDSEDRAQQRLTRALRDAADALEEVAPDRAGAGAELRTAADEIEGSGTDAREPADELRSALAAALDRLRERRLRSSEADEKADSERKADSKPEGASEQETATLDTAALDASLVELGRRVEALNTRRPLSEQRRAVGDSFRALGDTLFLAAGHEVPFGTRPPEPRSVADVLEQARADVLALGRADLANIRELTSRAMYSMADLVEAVAGRERVARQITEIQAEAQRLKNDDSGPFARAGWVERGLETALSTLDEVDSCHEALVAGWAEAARRATATLPERGALPFQHAAMQDAFRATLDAIGVTALDREACQTSAGQASVAAQPAR